MTIIGTRSFTQNLLNEKKKSVIATSHARIHETCKTIKMPPTSAKKRKVLFLKHKYESAKVYNTRQCVSNNYAPRYELHKTTDMPQKNKKNRQ